MKGSITSRGENTWRIRYYLPGTKKQKSVTFHGSYEDAELELARLLREAKTGFPTEPEKITVAELLDKWLATKKGKVKETTWQNYFYAVKKWKKTNITNILIQKLQPLDIELAITQMDIGKASSKAAYLTVLRIAFKKALKWKLLKYNPLDAVEPVKVERKEIRVWTEEEAARFLQTARKSKYYVLFYLALKTGARMGELLGLEWRNVDLEKKEIRVTQTLVRLPGKRQTQSPKSKQSFRKIPIDEQTATVLKQYRKQRLADAVKLGYGKIEWVFWTNRKGFPPRIGNVEEAIHKIAAKAGVPDLSPHGLRHTHATFLLRQGVHPKIVAERLGHSTLTMTDLYSHVLPDSQKEAVSAMEKLDF